MAKKILIVDDTDMSRRLIRVILLFHGYEVLEASNGEEGIAIARKQIPDLILMDIQMPVIDGYEAMKRLREDPVTQGIKIIAVTSYAMKGDRERFMEGGFEDYISKPVDTRQLPNIIKRHLGED